jgi:hypothetical protein
MVLRTNQLVGYLVRGSFMCLAWRILDIVLCFLQRSFSLHRLARQMFFVHLFFSSSVFFIFLGLLVLGCTPALGNRGSVRDVV